MVSSLYGRHAARVFGSFLLVSSLYVMGGVSPANASFATLQTTNGFTSQQQQFDWLAPSDGNSATWPVGQVPTAWGTLGSPNQITWSTVNGVTTSTVNLVNDDPIIPANLLAPKEAIKNAVQTYSSIPLVAYVPAVPAVPAQGTEGTAGYVPGTPGSPAIPASPTVQQLSLINTYTVQLDSDVQVASDPFYQQASIIIDGSQYYLAHGKTLTDGTSPANLCDSTNGCFLTVYMTSNPSNIITAAPAGAQSCPGSADQNIQCLAYCSATVSNCQGNFQYNTQAIYDQKVFAWNVITKAQFEKFTLSLTTPLYNIYNSGNANNILEVQLNDSICKQEELLVNGNLCIKYYQYDPSVQALVDLYNPALGSTTSNFSDSYSLVPFGSPFGSSVSHTGVTGKNGAGSGYGFPLMPGQTVDVQFETLSGAIPVNSSGISFTQASGYPLAGVDLVAKGLVASSAISPSFAAFHLANGTTHGVFVPTNSVKEFLSFLQQTVLDTSPQTTAPTVIPSGVLTATPINSSTTKYLALGAPPTPPSTTMQAWQGSAACPTTVAQLGAVTLTNYPCPKSGAITAYWEGMWTYAYGNAVGCTAAVTAAQERFCYASTGAVWQGGAGATSDCSICKNMPGYNFSLPTYTQGLTTGDALSGKYTSYDTIPAGKAVGDAVPNGTPLFNDTITVGGGSGSGCYAQVAACPSVVNWIGDAAHCLAGGAHVAISGDKVVLLSDIKAGDTILGFDKLNGKIKPFKVKEITVTQGEQTININRGRDPSHTLGLTANHSIVTGDGKTVLAADLKVGDTVLLASGDKVKIKSINLSKDKGTVYNLKLEDGGIGFIADGVRVLSVHEKAKQVDKL